MMLTACAWVFSRRAVTCVAPLGRKSKADAANTKPIVFFNMTLLLRLQDDLYATACFPSFTSLCVLRNYGARLRPQIPAEIRGAELL